MFLACLQWSLFCKELCGTFAALHVYKSGYSIHKPAILKLNFQLLLQVLQWPSASASLTFSSTKQEGKIERLFETETDSLTHLLGKSVHCKAVYGTSLKTICVHK